MTIEIECILTNENPEVKIRIAKFPCTNKKYSNRNIIIIPGWLSAIDNFTPTAKAMQSFGNIFIYEPRGFGESLTTHKKGLFSIEEYNNELSSVINHLQFEDKNFIILGSCSGGSQLFNYYLDGQGKKPNVLIVFSPQEHYKTPFWLPALGWLPTFIMKIVQRMIIVFYRLYLKLRRKAESENVTWADERLKKNDAWSLRRYVLEFVINHDIIDRQKEIDVPILMFVAKKDHFVSPEKANKFAHHKDSEVFQIDVSMHRVQEGNEKQIAEKSNEFLEKLGL